MLTNAHVWREAQERLRPEMTRAQFDTWLRGTRLATLEQGRAVLAVRTTFIKELLASQYRERIEAAIAAVTGRLCALEVVVAQSLPADEPAAAATEAALRTRTAARTAEPAREFHGRAERHARPDLGYTTVSLFGPASDFAPSSPAPTRPDVSAARSQQSHEPTQATVGGSGVRRGGASGGVPTGGGRAPGSGQSPNGPRRLLGRQGHEAPEGRAAMHSAGDDRSPRDGYDSGDEYEGNQYEQDDYSAADAARSSGRFRSPLSGPLSDPITRPLPALGGSGASGIHPAAQSGLHPGMSSGIHSGVPPLRLNPRYTFRTFIVGGSNQLAYAASVAVGDAPGQAYNPLFLYGGVGLGKTHLLHAVGHAAAEAGMAVLYATSETFTNEIVNAIMRRTTEEFRAKYRSVDVLLVDDIQFIAGKDSTEEEFFHTFNSLYESGRQIVICSDRPPKAIVSLEERLRSRFEWGMIADVQPPDFETRIAILRAKAEMMQRRIPDDVVEYLADRVQSNIRELEGSLNRLLAFSTLQRQPLTVDLAKAALATLASDARTRRVTIQEVLAAVSEFYHISAEDLRGKQRDKHIVVPRHVAMYLMRQETEASLMEIGQTLGGRDHSTVLHGCEKIGREINENTALRKEVVAIRQRLLG
jgi:chromosomal replication initiator protein